MASIPSKELLESNHEFPCNYVFKVIGLADGPFEADLLRVCGAELASPLAKTSKRHSADGKHVAVTLEVPTTSADHVILLYEKLMLLPGLTLLL